MCDTDPTPPGTQFGGFRGPHDFPDLSVHLPEPVERLPSPLGGAFDLLARSAGAGATIVCIGPWTNLALLDATRPACSPPPVWWLWAATSGHLGPGSGRGCQR